MNPDKKSPPIFIHPGEQHVASAAIVISTILGSCVAACLYDPVARIAGMNHFLLANQRYAKGMPLAITEAGRYGIHAMELTLDAMVKLGAQKRRLKAKAFGGASLVDSIVGGNFACVGEVNCRFIREFLSIEGIELVDEDLGGKQGRSIKFHTDTFEVAVKTIVRLNTENVEKQELGFWEKSISEHQKKPGKIVFF